MERLIREHFVQYYGKETNMQNLNKNNSSISFLNKDVYIIHFLSHLYPIFVLGL